MEHILFACTDRYVRFCHNIIMFILKIGLCNWINRGSCDKLYYYCDTFYNSQYFFSQQSCVQCSELYCPACFASFHLRGALKKHRSIPISVSTVYKVILFSTQVYTSVIRLKNLANNLNRLLKKIKSLISQNRTDSVGKSIGYTCFIKMYTAWTWDNQDKLIGVLYVFNLHYLLLKECYYCSFKWILSLYFFLCPGWKVRRGHLQLKLVNSNSLNSNFRITRVFRPVPIFFLQKVTKFTLDNSR